MNEEDAAGDQPPSVQDRSALKRSSSRAFGEDRPEAKRPHVDKINSAEAYDLLGRLPPELRLNVYDELSSPDPYREWADTIGFRRRQRELLDSHPGAAVQAKAADDVLSLHNREDFANGDPLAQCHSIEYFPSETRQGIVEYVCDPDIDTPRPSQGDDLDAIITINKARLVLIDKTKYLDPDDRSKIFYAARRTREATLNSDIDDALIRNRMHFSLVQQVVIDGLDRTGLSSERERKHAELQRLKDSHDINFEIVAGPGHEKDRRARIAAIADDAEPRVVNARVKHLLSYRERFEASEIGLMFDVCKGLRRPDRKVEALSAFADEFDHLPRGIAKSLVAEAGTMKHGADLGHGGDRHRSFDHAEHHKSELIGKLLSIGPKLEPEDHAYLLGEARKLPDRRKAPAQIGLSEGAQKRRELMTRVRQRGGRGL